MAKERSRRRRPSEEQAATTRSGVLAREGGSGSGSGERCEELAPSAATTSSRNQQEGPVPRTRVSHNLSPPPFLCLAPSLIIRRRTGREPPVKISALALDKRKKGERKSSEGREGW